MNLRKEQAAQVQKFITDLYAVQSEEEFIRSVVPQIAEIVSSDFYGLGFFPTQPGHRMFFSTNNDDDFTRLYSELNEYDIFLEYMAENGNSVALLRDVATPEVRRSNEFYNECEKVRPARDGAYFPLILNGRLTGFWAMGRERNFPGDYTEDEFKLARFLSSFLCDGIERALAVPGTGPYSAILDHEGRVVAAGSYVQNLFERCFGREHQNQPGLNSGINGIRFARRFNEFIRGPAVSGKAEVELYSEGLSHRLIFRRLPTSSLRTYFPDLPQVEVDVMPNGRLPLESAARLFQLTPRELDIIDCVFRGYSNKTTARELQVAEATVKHHLYNIYNKTGADSRTHLLFIIAGCQG